MYGYKKRVSFSFNETVLNSTIVNIASNYNNTLSINSIGNWTADSIKYSNRTDVQSWINNNYTNLNNKISSMPNLSISNISNSLDTIQGSLMFVNKSFTRIVAKICQSRRICNSMESWFFIETQGVQIAISHLR